MPSARFLIIHLLLIAAARPVVAAAAAARFDSAQTRAAHVWYWAHQEAPPDTIEARLRAGRALARRAGDGYGEIGYLNDLGQRAAQSGRYVEAQQLLGQALVLIRVGRHPRWLWITNLNLGALATQQGDHRRSVRFYEAALAAATRYRPVPSTAEADILACLVVAHGELRQRGPTYHAAQRAIALTQRQGDTYGEAAIKVSWAGELVDFQEPDSAVRLLEPALATLQRLHAPPHMIAVGQAMLVRAYGGQHDWPRLLALYPTALRGLRAIKNVEAEIELLETMGACLRALHRPAAFDTLHRAMVLQDSVRSRKKDQEVARLQVQSDVAGQQARIRALEQQRRIGQLQAERQTARNRLLVGGLAALALLLATGGLFYGRLRRTSAALAASEGQARQAEAQARTAENQAVAANATKDQLMSIIGHDLRGPVASFQQLTPVLQELVPAGPDAADTHRLLASLASGARHLGELLDNLLRWARTEGGQTVNHPAHLPLAEVAAALDALLQPAALAKGLTLTVAVAPPDLRAWADPDLLHTVLRNLLTNALKFTRAGGRVALHITADGAGAPGFRVTDTGVGIAPARLASLLQPGPGRTSQGTAGEPGTGLGLPLSARFVRLLGGELALTSRPGEGTTATFRLPRPA